jgi:hypothetical protein
VLQLLVTANVAPSSLIVSTLRPKRQLQQEAHGITSQKTTFLSIWLIQTVKVYDASGRFSAEITQRHCLTPRSGFFLFHPQDVTQHMSKWGNERGGLQ